MRFQCPQFPPKLFIFRLSKTRRQRRCEFLGQLSLNCVRVAVP